MSEYAPVVTHTKYPHGEGEAELYDPDCPVCFQLNHPDDWVVEQDILGQIRYRRLYPDD